MSSARGASGFFAKKDADISRDRYDDPGGIHRHLYDKATREACACCGSKYNISQKSLDQVLHPSESLGRYQPSKTPALAACLHNSKRRILPEHGLEREAFERLDKLFADPNPATHGPDLALKAFRDLDAVFFKGDLFGKIKVVWSPGINEANWLGYTQHSNGKATMIVLDAHNVFHPSKLIPYGVMFQTLIHEMVVSPKPRPKGP